MAKNSKRAGRPAGATAPTDESKADKFKRLAGARTAKTLKAIGLLGNLSGTGYEYTQDQVAKITAALNDKVKATMAKFAPRDPNAKKTEETFSL